MKRLLLPMVESLETKALLSHFAAGSATKHHETADVVGRAHLRVASELTITLDTNQSTYAVGQSVQMRLTATNNTRHNVAVWVGPNTQVFFITQNGQVIWRSNAGPHPLFPSVKRVLHPGESLTRTANWTATSTGAFVVHNQMAPRGPVATFSVVASQPPGPPVFNPYGGPPIGPPVQNPPVGPPVQNPPGSPPVGSELAFSLTTNQTSYTLGQTVHMTLTATNDTNHNVTVWVGPNTQVFFITENGHVIWRSNSGPQPLYPTVARVLSPGQSLVRTANWRATATGTFVVHNQMAPQGPVAMFNVTAT